MIKIYIIRAIVSLSRLHCAAKFKSLQNTKQHEKNHLISKYYRQCQKFAIVKNFKNQYRCIGPMLRLR